MALFQKKPDVTSAAPRYTVGSNKTILIIGLGNPGKQYSGTRHNVGFAALEAFAKANDFPGWVGKKDFKCELSIANLGQARVILCKPLTFMNTSGEAVQAVQHFYKVYNQHTLAIYDELAIDFGQIRARLGGTDAGHNGVKSLIGYIGEDFNRLRIGVGHKVSEESLPAGRQADAADFVLSKFSKTEQTKIPLILNEVITMLSEYIFGDSLPHDTRTVV